MDIRNRYDRCEVAILAATLPEAQAKAFHVVPNAKVDKAGDDSDQESYSESEEEATGGYPGGQKAPVAGELAQLLAMEPAPKVVVIYDADRGSYSSRMMSQIQATFPEAAIIGGVVMGRRVLARNGAVSCGRGVGALAISGNCPLFAMTCPFTGEVERAKQTVQSCTSPFRTRLTTKA